MPYCTSCQAQLSLGTRVCSRCRALQPVFEPPASQKPQRDFARGRVVYESKLGEGASAVVWKGSYFRRTATGHAAAIPVAVKEIRAGLQMDTARVLLRNEEVALRSLSGGPGRRHPNVIELIDSASPESADLALVFDHVSGETLEARLSRQLEASREPGGGEAGLSYGGAWTVLRQLLDALAAVHASGQVHADVKPANLLLRDDGVLKLTDFGLARPLHARVQPHEVGAGTSAYISPEQAIGHPLDGRSDLYSAASLLFEMIAGRTPFDTRQRTELAVRMDQVNREPPRLSTLVPNAPPRLDELLATSLAKNPAARFATADEMKTAFGAVLEPASRVHGRRR